MYAIIIKMVKNPSVYIIYENKKIIKRFKGVMYEKYS